MTLRSTVVSCCACRCDHGSRCHSLPPSTSSCGGPGRHERASLQCHAGRRLDVGDLAEPIYDAARALQDAWPSLQDQARVFGMRAARRSASTSESVSWRNGRCSTVRAGSRGGPGSRWTRKPSNVAASGPPVPPKDARSGGRLAQSTGRRLSGPGGRLFEPGGARSGTGRSRHRAGPYSCERDKADAPVSRRSPPQRPMKSSVWLSAVLFQHVDRRVERGALGQLDPGVVGGTVARRSRRW